MLIKILKNHTKTLKPQFEALYEGICIHKSVKKNSDQKDLIRVFFGLFSSAKFLHIRPQNWGFSIFAGFLNFVNNYLSVYAPNQKNELTSNVDLVIF